MKLMLNLLFVIGILLIYSGVSGIILDIIRKRKIFKRKYLILFLGIVLTISAILPRIYENKIMNLIKYMSIYFGTTFIIFCLVSILVNIRTKRKEYSVVIVLGGYLLDGTKLTRALKRRLDLLVKIYNNQKEKPKVIVSGGKIREEKITEAEAMKDYLIKNGVKESDIIKEEKSKNTLQNFQYSKHILNKMDMQKDIAFVSNNFHILRSQIYAIRAKIYAHGIGCTTLWYYFPEAIINEYLAVLEIYKIFLVIFTIIATYLAINGG